MVSSNHRAEHLAADPPGIARAASLLRAGRLVAFGTETVYGLGADANDGQALAALFAAKSRPRFNPLIVHLPSAEAGARLVRFTPLAWRLAAAFWPGPLTLVLHRAVGCPVHDLASAGLSTLALRVPAHPAARALLDAAGPVAAPSANRSGRVSPTTAAHVLAELGSRIDAVLDTGAARVGLESTVLDARGAAPVLLRHGGIPVEAIEIVAGPVLAAQETGLPHAPGQLASHYAPAAMLRLQASAIGPEEALLGFGPMPHDAVLARNLSPAADFAEAAANLFAHLRALDAEAAAMGLRRIAVMPVPEHGLGRAINDRLRRAAATRPEKPGPEP